MYPPAHGSLAADGDRRPRVAVRNVARKSDLAHPILLPASRAQRPFFRLGHSPRRNRPRLDVASR